MRELLRTVLKLTASFVTSLTLVIGAASVGLIFRRLMFDFTDYPEHLVRAAAPIVFLFVIFFCAKNTRIG